METSCLGSGTQLEILVSYEVQLKHPFWPHGPRTLPSISDKGTWKKIVVWGQGPKWKFWFIWGPTWNPLLATCAHDLANSFWLRAMKEDSCLGSGHKLEIFVSYEVILRPTFGHIGPGPCPEFLIKGHEIKFLSGVRAPTGRVLGLGFRV
jgi:hypothetical protein